VSQPMDSMYVAIEPDFSHFNSDAERGIDRVASSIEQTMTRMIETVEEMFSQLSSDIREHFIDISNYAAESFDRMELSADDVARSTVSHFELMQEQVDRAFDEIQRNASRQFNQIETGAKHTGSVAGGAGGLGFFGSSLLLGGMTAAAGGLEQVAQKGLMSAASMEQVQIAFESLTGSVAAGTKQFQDLQKFAAVTPFTFSDLTTGAQRFDAFSKTIGMTQDQLIPFLTTIGNLVSETGGGAQSLDTITLALGQTASQGKLTLGNLDQINNAIPGFSAVAALAAVRGETTAQVMQEISSGSIDASTGIKQLLQGMQQFPGAAGAMEKQSQTLLGVWSTFTDTMSQALVSAFQPVIPTIKDALTTLTPILQSTLNVLGPALGAVLSAALPLLGQLAKSLSGVLAPILDALGQGLKDLGPALGPLGDALGHMASALAPIIPVIAQLIAAFAQGLAPIINALAPAVAQLVQALTPVLQALAPLIVQIAQALASEIGPLAQFIGQLMQALGPALTQLITALTQALQPILAALGPYMAQFVQELTPLIPAIVQLVESFIQIVVAATPFIPLLLKMTPLILKILPPIIQLATWFVQLNALWLKIIPLGGQLGTIIGTWLGPKIRELVGFVREVIQWFDQLPSMIGGALSALPGILENAATSAFHAFFFAIGYGIGLIINEWNALPGQISAIIQNLWNTAVNLFHAGVNGIRDAITALPGLISNFFSNARSSAVSQASSLVDGVINFFRTLPSRAVSAIGNLGDTVKNALSGAGNWLVQTGKDIINGLIAGIESEIKSAINVITNAMNDIVTGAKHAIGAHSPSRVFAEEVGEPISQGIGVGVMSASGAAISAINAVTSPANVVQSTSVASSSSPITFGPGSIVVNLPVGSTAQQANQAGQSVAAGILDRLNDAVMGTMQQNRTVLAAGGSRIG